MGVSRPPGALLASRGREVPPASRSLTGWLIITSTGLSLGKWRQPQEARRQQEAAGGPLLCLAPLGPHLPGRRWNAVPARGAGWFTCPRALINGEAAGEQSLKPNLSSLPGDRPDPDASGWGVAGKAWRVCGRLFLSARWSYVS